MNEKGEGLAGERGDGGGNDRGLERRIEARERECQGLGVELGETECVGNGGGLERARGGGGKGMIRAPRVVSTLRYSQHSAGYILG